MPGRGSGFLLSAAVALKWFSDRAVLVGPRLNASKLFSFQKAFLSVDLFDWLTAFFIWVGLLIVKEARRRTVSRNGSERGRDAWVVSAGLRSYALHIVDCETAGRISYQDYLKVPFDRRTRG